MIAFAQSTYVEMRARDYFAEKLGEKRSVSSTVSRAQYVGEPILSPQSGAKLQKRSAWTESSNTSSGSDYSAVISQP